jgi:uncharacterized C2H2 Zn-finger protein
MYQCLKCGAIYKYKQYMLKHLREVHRVSRIKVTELYYMKIDGGSPGVWWSYC